VVIAVLVGVEVFEFRVWRWAVRQRPRAGAQGIVGEVGVLGDGGRVRIRGTSYPARVLEGRPGDRVRVEEVDGFTLVVRRTADP
jgi:membrane protein implicated in regulation of membrane protease activity